MRPYEEELHKATLRLNEAMVATLVARQEEARLRDDYQTLSRLYYAANPDLPVPEGLW